MRWAAAVGDASMRTEDGGRPCFRAQLYADAAMRIRDAYAAHAPLTVLLATDAHEASAKRAHSAQILGMYNWRKSDAHCAYLWLFRL